MPLTTHTAYQLRSHRQLSEREEAERQDYDRSHFELDMHAYVRDKYTPRNFQSCTNTVIASILFQYCIRSISGVTRFTLFSFPDPTGSGDETRFTQTVQARLTNGIISRGRFVHGHMYGVRYDGSRLGANCQYKECWRQSQPQSRSKQNTSILLTLCSRIPPRSWHVFRGNRSQC